MGGSVEKGETPLQAAKRELEEETGLKSKKWSKLFSWEFAGNVDSHIHYFIAKDCELKGEKQEDPSERIKLQKSSFSFFVKNVVSDPTFRDRPFYIYLYNKLNPEKVKELKQKLF
ncbi:MAG: NUDIX hydrolase [Alphaproteobacteria bacterium]|nr:NUDIX hydrolase [Alphaproteobacteria bacterium]